MVDKGVDPVALALFRSFFPRGSIARAVVMVGSATAGLAVMGIVRQGILMEEGFRIVRVDGLIVLVDGVSSPGQEFVNLFIDVADIGVQIFPIGVHFGSAGHLC